MADVKDNIGEPKSETPCIWTAASFIFGISAMSIFAGFGLTVGRARKRSPRAFDDRSQEATKLALRALGYGTLFSVAGVGSIVLALRTIFGVKNTKEFGDKMRSFMPQKDGELVNYFKNWRIPRKSGNDEEQWEKAVSGDPKSTS